MIGEDGKVYRARPNRQPTAEFNEAINKLRQELAEGPFGMCDALEYAPLDETEQRIQDLKGERQYGRIHGSDLRRIAETPEDTGHDGEKS